MCLTFDLHLRKYLQMQPNTHTFLPIKGKALTLTFWLAQESRQNIFHTCRRVNGGANWAGSTVKIGLQ